MKNEMKEKSNIIILNFMFSGEYLDDNIGHEIINLYSSDSGEKYVYLCYDGEINIKEHPVNNIEHIVFVRRTEIANQIEILGFTEGHLSYIPTDDKRQYDAVYGGVKLGDIFSSNNRQQSVNITFKVTEEENKSRSTKRDLKPNIYRVKESFNISIKDFGGEKQYRF